MTEGPPPWAASSSETPNSGASTTPQSTTRIPSASSTFSVPSSSSVPVQQPYLYSSWNNTLSSNYAGYAPAANLAAGTLQPATPGQYVPSNPYTTYRPHTFQSQPHNPYSQLAKSTPKTKSDNIQTSTKPVSPPVALLRPPTPPLPEPDTYKHWDEVVKKFLEQTKMSQALKGFENDMLVLNPEWEQKTIPDALKEMVNDLQTILDRISGKKRANEDAMQTGEAVDITTIEPNEPANEERTLDERKLDYIHLANGEKPRSQSSINKSISQFLAQTRARNDASNRAEFLFALAEKKRRLLAELESQSELGPIASPTECGREEKGTEPREFSSCARVDAKPIDRDKQMKYDIAKYEEGPLTRTVKNGAVPPPSPAISSSLAGPSLVPTVRYPPPTSHASTSTPTSETKPQTRKKRRFAAVEESTDQGPASGIRSSSKSQGKGKERTRAIDVQDEDTILSSATAERHPGLDERLRNVEAHLAVRYVPSPPRTLVARLKYLEDYLIKLEREYPPWAALHFNQPNRGWPPPPRTTPIIVPPHLRSVASTNTTPASLSSKDLSVTSSAEPSSTSTGSGQAKGTSSSNTYSQDSTTGGQKAAPSIKTRNKTSSLHKAVLDRLEVQRAMSEMSGKLKGASGQ